MATCVYDPSTPTYLPLLRHTNITPDSPGQPPMMGDETPLPSQKLDSDDRKVVLYNNNFGEGVTINIFSSNSTRSTVSKLECVTRAAQPTTLERPSARQLAPVEFGRDGVIFSSNMLHEHVVINIALLNSTGAVYTNALGMFDFDFIVNLTAVLQVQI
ncbi:uncharacterized protein EDB91DRAFT_1081042 [Suillus paluster]|uniref:uncharacterized protein n=1 Tax=Suillus paluster TaxID=48578 RepID=UPI001B861D40|nr:uncharacterized protein EDB91DRAFT_1081042 [Suillus paluster]KAG1743662.1 hypothetical protein EDB91DRAFT_1081042 [Suillus paluster]